MGNRQLINRKVIESIDLANKRLGEAFFRCSSLKELESEKYRIEVKCKNNKDIAKVRLLFDILSSKGVMHALRVPKETDKVCAIIAIGEEIE